MIIDLISILLSGGGLLVSLFVIFKADEIKNVIVERINIVATTIKNTINNLTIITIHRPPLADQQEEEVKAKVKNEKFGL